MDGIGVAEVVEISGMVVGSAGVVAGFVWAAYRIACRICRAIVAADRLHDLLGRTPVDELHRIVSETATSVGEIGIRQRITERHLSIGIFVCDASGRTTWANDYLCESFGIDSSSIDGFGWLSAVAKPDRQRVYEEWTRCVQNDLPYRDRYMVEPQHGGQPWECVTEAWPKKEGERTLYYVGYAKRVEE